MTRRPLSPRADSRSLTAAILLALTPVAAMAPIPPAQAQVLFGAPIAQAEILPGWQNADGTRTAALRLTMQTGWHTYWRIPGEAGIPPRFDWSGSQNVASIEPIWPRPSVFVQNGLQSYGYEDELILPLRITPRNANRAVAIIGELAIGVCRDTCVPADVSVRGALRGRGGDDRRIHAALQQQATPAAQIGLRRVTCRVVPAARGAELTLRARVPQIGGREQIVMELPGSGYWISDSETWREGADLVARARVRNPQHGPVGINRAMVGFTILADNRMAFSQGCTGG